MYKVVLLRHGESDWNRENRFTGWTDVDLSDKGREEAKAAGQLVKIPQGMSFRGSLSDRGISRCDTLSTPEIPREYASG